MHIHQSGSHAVMRGNTAKQYDRISRWLLPSIYRAVAADISAGIALTSSVLDVGTGPGRLLVQLAHTRPDLQLTGVDPSEDMVAFTRANASKAGLDDRVNVVAGFAEELPFPSAAFDAVVSTFSAHHWADPAGAMADFVRVLRPGGQVRIYDFKGKQLHELTAGPLPAGLTRAPTGKRRVGRIVKAFVTVTVAEKAPR